MASKTHTATIIVSVVVIQEGKLLMMQEAKPECSGKWYIPAGRVEVGEDISTAAARECFEETGLELQVEGIFSVSHMVYGKNDWIRYGIGGRIVGGDLKTKADQESLQAAWVPLDQVQNLSLRATDFLNLVKLRQECAQLIKIA